MKSALPTLKLSRAPAIQPVRVPSVSQTIAKHILLNKKSKKITGLPKGILSSLPAVIRT